MCAAYDGMARFNIFIVRRIVTYWFLFTLFVFHCTNAKHLMWTIWAENRFASSSHFGFCFSPLVSRRRSTNLQPVAINAQIVCNVGTCGCDCISKHNEFYAKSPQFCLMPFRLSRAVASMPKSSFTSSRHFVWQYRVLTYDLLQMRKIYEDMMCEHLRATRIYAKWYALNGVFVFNAHLIYIYATQPQIAGCRWLKQRIGPI